MQSDAIRVSANTQGVYGPQIFLNACTMWQSAEIYPALIDVQTNTDRITAGAFYCPLYDQTCKRSEKLGTLTAHRVKGKQLLSKIKQDIHRLSVEICQSEERQKTTNLITKRYFTKDCLFQIKWTFKFNTHITHPKPMRSTITEERNFHSS